MRGLGNRCTDCEKTKMSQMPHQASCSAVTHSLGLMAGHGMLLPAPLGDRCRDMLLSASLGTMMLGRFQPGTAAGAPCMQQGCSCQLSSAH